MVKEVKALGSPCGKIVSARYLLATLGSIGLGLIYGLKVNLHVAIINMVKTPHSTDFNYNLGDKSQEEICADQFSFNFTESQINSETGTFDWSSNIQGFLLSAYFWGYILAQIPGGRIAEVFSAKWVMFFSVAINVVCTLLTPIMAHLHYTALIAMRIGEGIGGGATFPAMHVMLAHWAPPNERSVMSSITYAGTALGTVVSMLVSGIIAGTIGWEAIFYIEGGFSLLWLLLWALLVADTPQEQRFITEEERNFIITSLGQGKSNSKPDRKHPVPWKSVLTSPPFLAILVAHTCSNWGWYMVLIELPLYMKNVLHFKISENAVLTAVPFLCMWLFSMILSKTLDTLQEKKIINTTMARKIATGCASIVPMICFICLGYIHCERVLAVVLLTVAVMSIGGMFCGFLSNHIDIAPNFAGTLIALTNTVATVPGIVVPVFVGRLTSYDKSVRPWRTIFWTTVVLYVVEIFVYMIFGSGVEQPWNKIEESLGETQPLKPKHEEKHHQTTREESNKSSV